MRLFIAEKPDLARAIVEGLGGGEQHAGYYTCPNNNTVTWCFGHMLQLCDPEDYDEKYALWTMDTLPVFFIPWKKKVAEDKKKQVDIIINLIRSATEIVNAGDPDDEGQLLIDEILEYANCNLPVKRILINDNTPALVKKALASLKDNKDFAGLSASAEARSVADQLVGYNLTRACTVMARRIGYDGVLSVGRVQTPILGLVVRRDRENAGHVKAYYSLVTGLFAIGDATFPARYQVTDGDPVDDRGRISDHAFAKDLAAQAIEKPIAVVSATTTKKDQSAPLPYNLLKLQTDAARKFGLKPDQVKDITQNLREKHRLITYNRSDCEYLSDEQHPDAPAVLAAIAATAPALAPAVKRADPSLKSRAFNSGKVSAHHAIIPTQATADFAKLTEDEQRIYMMVARAYIGQFFPLYRYDQTTIIVELVGTKRRFSVRSNVPTASGWKPLYAADTGNDELTEAGDDDIGIDLRALTVGQNGTCTQATADRRDTKAAPLYTIATLLQDLTRVAKYVRDPHLRTVLIEKDKNKAGEHGGIGTPATRDTILKTLFDRGYLVEKGKSVVSTPTGREFYDALPDAVKYPDMTAIWHEQQLAIQRGDLSVDAFIRDVVAFIDAEVKGVATKGVGIKVKTEPCPLCGKPLRRLKQKDKDKLFWLCDGVKDGSCHYSCDDQDGKPEAPSTYKCLVCGKPLSRRKGKKKGFFWGCLNYPTCKTTYPDKKGKPDYAKKSG